jgi:hypothetical protein
MMLLNTLTVVDSMGITQLKSYLGANYSKFKTHQFSDMLNIPELPANHNGLSQVRLSGAERLLRWLRLDIDL